MNLAHLAILVVATTVLQAQGNTYLAYPQDTVTGSWTNALPLGQGSVAAGQEARVQMLIPRAFLPSTGGSVVAIEVVPGVTRAVTYDSLVLTMDHMSHPVAFPTLQIAFAANRNAPQTVLSIQNTTIQYGGQQWHRIGLQQPFAYNGTDHLLLEFVKSVPPQGTSGLGMRTPRDERSDVPRVLSARGAYRSGASNSTTGLLDTWPLRMRLVFAGDVPTTVVRSDMVGGVYFGIGTNVSLETHTAPARPAWQLLDVSNAGLVARPTPWCLPALLGCTWLLPGPGLAVLSGGITGGNGVFATTLPLPADPTMRGLAVALQSVVIGTTGPAWSSATDFVIG